MLMDQPARPLAAADRTRDGAADTQPGQGLAALLARMVEQQIAPRLLLAHGCLDGAIAPDAPGRATLRAQQVAHDDTEAALRRLAALNPGGRCFLSICRDILVREAAALRAERADGSAEESDYLVGMGRLRMVLIGLDDVPAPAPDAPPSVVLVAGDARTPTLEHAMVGRAFAHAGWSVRHCGRRLDGMADSVVAQGHFDAAWFSVDDETPPGLVAASVAALRARSLNRRIGVLCGGQALVPSLAATAVGADAVTDDATQAALLAERLLDRQRAWLPPADHVTAC